MDNWKYCWKISSYWKKKKKEIHSLFLISSNMKISIRIISIDINIDSKFFWRRLKVKLGISPKFASILFYLILAILTHWYPDTSFPVSSPAFAILRTPTLIIQETVRIIKGSAKTGTTPVPKSLMGLRELKIPYSIVGKSENIEWKELIILRGKILRFVKYIYLLC